MQPTTKRLLVNEAQLQKIFEQQMLRTLENHYIPDQPIPSVTVNKDDLVKTIYGVNYVGINSAGTANEPTPARKKIIQISAEQLNRMVAKLLIIEMTVANNSKVEGFGK
jgi:hypothetical protein